MVKRVITYGTFDMFHIGHLNLLKKAKERGNELVVAISTDEFNELKGKSTLIPFEQRVEIVSSIRYVDLVIPENSWDQKIADIKKYEIDLLVMGHDWEGKFDDLKQYCDVEYFPRTEGISTTMLKKSLGNFLSVTKDEILRAFKVLEQLKTDLE